MSVSFESIPGVTVDALSKIASFAREIDAWMPCNKLKLVVLRAQHLQCPLVQNVPVTGKNTLLSTSSRNIGVIFDPCINVEQPVQNICKIVPYHIRNITKTRRSKKAYTGLPVVRVTQKQ